MNHGFMAGLGMAGLLACAYSPAVAQDDDKVLDRTPQDCISTNRISYTKVVDDRTILFYMISQTVYRNDLRQVCPGLALRDRFSYSTRNGRLCDVDAVTVPYSGRAVPCTLGEFYPVTREEARALRRDPDELDAIERSIVVEQVELPPEEADAGAPE
jgi:hypothetical protein